MIYPILGLLMLFVATHAQGDRSDTITGSYRFLGVGR